MQTVVGMVASYCFLFAGKERRLSLFHTPVWVMGWKIQTRQLPLSDSAYWAVDLFLLSFKHSLEGGVGSVHSSGRSVCLCQLWLVSFY